MLQIHFCEGFMRSTLTVKTIEQKNFLVRGQKVMLDSDLAELYGVLTKVLLQAIKRNAKRFPQDLMFQLSETEDKVLRSQLVTLKTGRGQHRKYRPYVFTEQGVSMLSSVLNSDRAIEVNIQIMRTFVKLREMIASHRNLARRLDEREKKYDAQFKVVFDAIRELMTHPDEDKRKIGFLARESRTGYRTVDA